MSRRIAVLAVLAAGLTAGCGSTTKTTSTPIATQPATQTARSPTVAEAESAAIARRVKARCARQHAEGSVETIQECERSQRKSEALLAESKRSLAEGQAEQERLKREEAAQTPAEKQRIARERERGPQIAKELKETAERDEVEEKRHKREHTYPPAAQQAFMIGCKADEGSSSLCTCALHKIEARETLPEFEALSYALTHGAKVPEGLKEALEACKFSGG
jgi:hypothetical protein